MKKLTHDQLALELDAALKRLGNKLQIACLYRSYAGSVLLSLGSTQPHQVSIGSITIKKNDWAVTLGTTDEATFDDPQRMFEAGKFHAWIVRKTPLSVIDLSARHFAEYDKKGKIGKLKDMPIALIMGDLSAKRHKAEISYSVNKQATLWANAQYINNGMPDELWQLTHDVGKVFGISVPTSYKQVIY